MSILQLLWEGKVVYKKQELYRGASISWSHSPNDDRGGEEVNLGEHQDCLVLEIIRTLVGGAPGQFLEGTGSKFPMSLQLQL